jgi:hypothetical protein
MSEPSPIDVINYCIEHCPDALGVIAFGPRVKKVKFIKRRVRMPAEIDRRPAKRSDPVDVEAELFPKHRFEDVRTALVLAEMPERVGVNLKGPAENQDFYIMFVVDRAVYDRLQRQAASGLILPPGVQI